MKRLSTLVLLAIILFAREARAQGEGWFVGGETGSNELAASGRVGFGVVGHQLTLGLMGDVFFAIDDPKAPHGAVSVYAELVLRRRALLTVSAGVGVYHHDIAPARFGIASLRLTGRASLSPLLDVRLVVHPAYFAMTRADLTFLRINLGMRFDLGHGNEIGVGGQVLADDLMHTDRHIIPGIFAAFDLRLFSFDGHGRHP